MNNKTLIAACLVLAGSGAAQAQTCTCNGGSGTKLTTALAVTNLLTNKMVCGAVGGEQWQEWHNGTSSGPVVDYKKGPDDPVDRSTPVGSYVVNADGTVTYTYGAQSYKYDVCSTGGTYAFCGSPYTGRDITDVTVAGTGGLQPCSAVMSMAASTRRKR